MEVLGGEEVMEIELLEKIVSILSDIESKVTGILILFAFLPIGLWFFFGELKSVMRELRKEDRE